MSHENHQSLTAVLIGQECICLGGDCDRDMGLSLPRPAEKHFSHSGNGERSTGRAINIMSH